MNLHLEPDLNDGVVLNIAPLWELVPWKEAKAYWEDLLAGKYEWSTIGKQLRKGAGEMTDLVGNFAAIKGNGTRQIGRNFCIPATVCSALRILGVAGVNQEAIRDAWYRHNGRAPEAIIDDQMIDASFGVADVYLKEANLKSIIGSEQFERPRDDDPLLLSKADEALTFVEQHVCRDHPVIVSTWNLAVEQGQLTLKGFHMLLVLAIDPSGNLFVGHDPWRDDLIQGPIRNPKQIQLATGEIELETGLRGSITHSDYSCLALWRL